MNDTFDSPWGRERYPTRAARLAADRATDALDPNTASMAQYIDTWLAAYGAAGGVEVHAKGGKTR